MLLHSNEYNLQIQLEEIMNQVFVSENLNILCFMLYAFIRRWTQITIIVLWALLTLKIISLIEVWPFDILLLVTRDFVKILYVRTQKMRINQRARRAGPHFVDEYKQQKVSFVLCSQSTNHFMRFYLFWITRHRQQRWLIYHTITTICCFTICVVNSLSNKYLFYL